MRAALVALSFVVPALGGPSPTFAGEERAAATAGLASTINVSFKLDPRLSGATYGGERWVSPRTYTGATAQDGVEARAVTVDAKGRPLQGNPEWAAADPDLVKVSPARGERVTITARRAGESAVTVTSGGATRRLIVRAVLNNAVWQVSISQ